MHFRIAILLSLLLQLSGVVFAQTERQPRIGSSIVDDSTKQVYSPATTEYTTLSRLKTGWEQYQKADTTIYDFHRKFDPVDNSNFMLQDLGNIGTAIRPFYQPIPKTVGMRSGYRIYDYFYTDPSERRFFNTKSPHSWFTIFWGGRGRSVTNAGYTRNINPQWNFGFDVNAIYVDKIIGRVRRGDRNVESMNYNFYTWYRSKDKKYLGLASYGRIKHQVHEMGGVQIDSVNTPLEEFFERTADSYLQDALAIETRNDFYVYQKYGFTELFGPFHSFKIGRQVNEFLFKPNQEQYFSYDSLLISPKNDTASDKSKLRFIENKLGITGNGKDFYYEVYYKARHVAQFYKFLSDTANIRTTNREDYGGVTLGGNLDSLVYGSFQGEYLENGNFRSDLNVNFKYGGINWIRSIWEPSFVEQEYLGHFDYWSNNFEPINAYDTRIYLQWGNDHFHIKPNATFQSFDNLTYFEDVGLENPLDDLYNYFKDLRDNNPDDLSSQITYKYVENRRSELDTVQNIIPVQDKETINLTSPGLDFTMSFFNIYWKNSVKYNILSRQTGHGLALPKWHLNTRLGYQNIFFQGNLQIQGGVDIHWQSTYYAYGYNPIIQQFYLQRDIEVQDYWLINAFLNVKINRVRAFFKINNMRMFFNDIGYFTTPLYPGINSLIDFGFNWDFYD